MIRCGEETTVWFQLASEPRRKISWRIDEYLAYAKTSNTEAEARMELFKVGVISDLTEGELAELGHNRLGSRVRLQRMAARAGA